MALWLPNAFSSNYFTRDADSLFAGFRRTGAVIDSALPSGPISLPVHAVDPDRYFEALAERATGRRQSAASSFAPRAAPWAACSTLLLALDRDSLRHDDAERILATLAAQERERREQRRRRGAWRENLEETSDRADGHHIELELEQKHKSKKDKQAEQDDDAAQKTDDGKIKDGKDKAQDSGEVKHDAAKDKKPAEKDKQPFDKNRVNVNSDSRRLVRDKKWKDKDGKRDRDDGKKRRPPEQAAG
jgi:hypothetical protein